MAGRMGEEGQGFVKRSWTDADFADLSWHDCSVHALRIVEGPHGAGELLLDLDYILQWLPSGGHYQFSIAPAELRFIGVTDLRMSIDYAAVSAGFTPFTLDGIRCEPDASIGQQKRWTLKINWPTGELSFRATGFTQALTGEPSISPLMMLTPRQRGPYIATRVLTAFHPSRGAFEISVRIGCPYQITPDEWACPVELAGLRANVHDAHGIDAFQALMLAQNLARTLLAYFVEDGGRLSGSPEGKDVDLKALFSAGTE
jgi:hypothetical protein